MQKRARDPIENLRSDRRWGAAVSNGKRVAPFEGNGCRRSCGYRKPPCIDFKHGQCRLNDSQAQASRVTEHPARFDFTTGRTALYDDFSYPRRLRLSSSTITNIYACRRSARAPSPTRSTGSNGPANFASHSPANSTGVGLYDGVGCPRRVTVRRQVPPRREEYDEIINVVPGKR